MSVGVILLVKAPVAYAFMGECSLEVYGRTYINGSCNIEMMGGGDFTIGAGEPRRSEYFAYVFLDRDAPGTARGYWNGTRASSHAHDELGRLSRHGGCWINDRAKVCAWKAGTRPGNVKKIGREHEARRVRV